MSDWPLTALVIAGDAETRGALRRLVEAGTSASGVMELSAAGEAAGVSRPQQPDLVVLAVTGEPEPGSGELVEEVERVGAAFPQAAIVVTGPALSGTLLLQVSRAGALDYLVTPVRPADLRTALGKVERLRSTTAPPPRPRGRVTAVYSRKGGVGVTTLATNLGVALAQRGAEEVVLVDLDLAQSHVATFLDIRGTYSVLDAFENIDRLDELYLRGLLVRHDSGLWVLPGPARPTRVPAAGEDVQRGLAILRAHFDHIVLDLRHELDEGTTVALREADTVLLLTGLDVPSIGSTGAALGAFRDLRLDLERVHLVLARHGAREDIAVTDAEGALGKKIAFRIPSDYPTVMASVNAGRPAVLAAARSKVAQSIAGLATTLGRPSSSPDRPRRAPGPLLARLGTSWRLRRATP
jgi:pilus assembly protein CpaE